MTYAKTKSPFASALYADTPDDMRAAVVERLDVAMAECRNFASASKTFSNKRIYNRVLSELYFVKRDILAAHIIPKHMDPRVSDAMKERAADRDQGKLGL